MTDLIMVVVLAIICGAAGGYLYQAKKRGVKCIGCPAGKGGCCSCRCAEAPTPGAGVKSGCRQADVK